MSDQPTSVPPEPPTRFQHGDRVRLTADHPYAPGASGVLASFPQDLCDLRKATPLSSTQLSSDQIQKILSDPDPESNTYYWVVLDAPAFDDEGHSVNACEVHSHLLAPEDAPT